MEPIQAVGIITAISFLLATGAALIRFFASREVRITLDALFLSTLILPAFCELIFHLRGTLFLEAVGRLSFIYFFAIMGFRRVNRMTIDAARLQGLGRCGIFWHLFFPVAWPWLLGGLAVNLELIGHTLMRHA